MEYKILESKNIEGLIKSVNENLLLGWKVQGGISVVKNNIGDGFLNCYQAMVKN